MKRSNYKMDKSSPLTRINKHLSEIGFCSRREADKLIDSGRVLINGKKAEMGAKVSSDDKVIVNGELLKPTKNKNVYLAFNKPRGIVSVSYTHLTLPTILLV